MTATFGKTTAYVLAGGGSLGAVEVGMLRALAEHGEQADMIVGSSAGAINSAYFAADPTVHGIGKLEAVWRALTRADVLPITLANIWGVLRRRDYLVDSAALRALLERHLPYRLLENAGLPVHVVATDLLAGEEVVLSRGPAVQAVLASAAIPGIFPPVRIDGRDLIDGGVANNTPISCAVALGATRLIVLPTGFACALAQIPRGAIGRAMHALGLLVARQLTNDVERYRNHVEVYVVPPLCPLEAAPHDYSCCGGLIDRSLEQTRTWIEGGGLHRPHDDVGMLRPHSH